MKMEKPFKNEEERLEEERRAFAGFNFGPHPQVDVVECEHNVVLGNMEGGYFCGTCNADIPREYVHKQFGIPEEAK